MTVSYVGRAVWAFPMVLAYTESVSVTDCVLSAGLTIASIWATTSTADGVTYTDIDSTVFARPVFVTDTISVFVTASELSAEETISSRTTITACIMVTFGVTRSSPFATCVTYPEFITWKKDWR